MTSTDFNRNATEAWFVIDICTPPVEADEEERNTEHVPTDHNHFYFTTKKDTNTTSNEPPLIDEPVMVPEIRIPFMVTERPPVRMMRPSTPEMKKQSTNVTPKLPTRWEEVLSSLLQDNPNSDVEAVFAMALRRELASPGTGLSFFVANLATNPTIPPAWFAILYERMDSNTQKILLSFLSEEPVASLKVPNTAQQGLFFVNWLLFILGCLLTPLFLLLRKWNESRHVQSWEYADIEEQY
ncbi:hypothetical protein FisN_13Lu342 [Fistulifera solaris]|uniref:Uncharacterized protein n=1 Tax=Fistulifera solaris TaxID=1519565 RepID=A0A1Z5KLJ4_FISSO|nr:hypothetical protein FisN_13Lu342 [Fistulifera solaris]|eukprot:GAX27149.1 hypothetical protein FisN_13Lu342 [Fistulifera solaris]